MKKEELRGIEEVKDLLEQIDFDFDITTVKDNTIQFEYEDILYRIKMPNMRIEKKLSLLRNKYKISLLKNVDYLTRRQIIDLYKKKGIDIAELDEKMTDVEDAIKEKSMKLATTPSKDMDGILFLKNQIVELKNNLYSISAEKAGYLEDDSILI